MLENSFESDSSLSTVNCVEYALSLTQIYEANSPTISMRLTF